MKTRIFGKIFITLCILISIALAGLICNAQSAEDYAPIFYFEGGENCYPVSVDYLFDIIGDYNSTKTVSISGENLPYYDNTMGTFEDNGVINDYKKKIGQYGYTVYFYEGIEGSTSFIQYWMFYAFNDGENNRHEGDWEMVEVVIPASGNRWVGYSQHYSGQQATWSQVERDGNHIKVYVAKGSHANYLRSYSGKLGIASDIVGDNGKKLTPDEYTLIELSDQDWLEFEGLWGEINDAEDLIMGTAGPQGPMFREDMNGNLMWNGVSWGQGLMQANDIFFTIELFLYNFVTIVILITIIVLALLIYGIYKRHKKFGLGPRIVSMLYIDGLNLKSIGNILCIVGIIIAIIGLFNQWYVISADINVEGMMETGMIDIISIDGINGVQITMPGSSGPIPMGSISIPFYLILLIGFIFMIISTVGVHLSKKLGKKYLLRGIRLFVVVIILIIAIMSIGLMAGISASGEGIGSYIGDFLNSISSNPFGGTYSFTIAETDAAGNINAEWGLGFGAILLLIAGIILIIAGALEIVDNKKFFTPKITEEKIKKEPIQKQPAEDKILENKK
jgi:hypothetical protein